MFALASHKCLQVTSFLTAFIYEKNLVVNIHTSMHTLTGQILLESYWHHYFFINLKQHLISSFCYACAHTQTHAQTVSHPQTYFHYHFCVTCCKSTVLELNDTCNNTWILTLGVRNVKIGPTVYFYQFTVVEEIKNAKCNVMHSVYNFKHCSQKGTQKRILQNNKMSWTNILHELKEKKYLNQKIHIVKLNTIVLSKIISCNQFLYFNELIFTFTRSSQALVAWHCMQLNK